MNWLAPSKLLIVNCLVWLMIFGHRSAVLGQEAARKDSHRVDGMADTLDFRFCPPGSYLRQNLRVVDAWSAKPEVRQVKTGFWIQETELSLEQYRVIQQFSVKRAQETGKQPPTPLLSLKELNQRAGTAFDAIFNDEAIRQQKPVTGLTLLEALGVTANLSLMMSGDSSGVSLTKNLYAIPDVTRWEYACLAAKANESEVELFSSWNPALWKAFEGMSPTWQNDCNEFMIDLGTRQPLSSAEFAKHAAKYLEDAKTSAKEVNKRRSKINALLHHSLKIATPSLDMPFGLELNKNEPEILMNTHELSSVYLKGVNTGSENSWHIKRMHGNAAEWVIDIPASNLESMKVIESLNQVWNNESPDIPSDVNVVLAGGSVCDTNWISFAVGGGSETRTLRDLVNPNVDPAIVKGLNLIRGVRMIYIVSLKADWRKLERLQYLTLFTKQRSALKRQLSAWHDEVGAIPTADAGDIRKLIGAHVSLLAAHGIDAGPNPKPLIEIGNEFNDRYFALLGQMVALDSK